MEAETSERLPQKRYFRQRAHCNPMSDHDLIYPLRPDVMDWKPLFCLPDTDENTAKSVEFLDVGCGYGGLLVALSVMFPDKLMLGLEIRIKVGDFAQEKISALRKHNDGQYGNIACLRTNAMKYLPNFFNKHQLNKMFFLYPDPHFKKANHKRRIISTNLLAEYAFILRPNGILYTITDVEEVHLWMVKHISRHPLFQRILGDELESDPVVPLLYESTEEGKKVARNKGNQFAAVFKRVCDSYEMDVH